MKEDELVPFKWYWCTNYKVFRRVQFVEIERDTALEGMAFVQWRDEETDTSQGWYVDPSELQEIVP